MSISRRSIHGAQFTDHEADEHLVRSLSHVFGAQKGTLLSKSDLTCQVLEDVVFSAQGDMDMAREQELKNGMGYILVVPGSGQGNGGAPHGGAVGRRGGRGRSRGCNNRGEHQQ